MTDMLKYCLKAFDLDYAWPFEKARHCPLRRAAHCRSGLLLWTTTMDDAPMLYKGMEVGVTTESGAPALFEKLPVFWQISERRAKFLPSISSSSRPASPLSSAAGRNRVGWERCTRSRSDFLRRGAGEECFVAIHVSNQPYAGVADAPAGEYVDETPGLDDAAGQKISLPGPCPEGLGLPGLPQSPLVMTSRRSPLLRARELFMVFA
jgi:hypothetical protein